MLEITYTPQREVPMRTGNRSFRSGNFFVLLTPGKHQIEKAAYKALSRHPAWKACEQQKAIAVRDLNPPKPKAKAEAEEET